MAVEDSVQLAKNTSNAVIDERDILDTAPALGLTPHVVEKHGLLRGVSTREAIAESWVFKGETCLKQHSCEPTDSQKTPASP